MCCAGFPGHSPDSHHSSQGGLGLLAIAAAEQREHDARMHDARMADTLRRSVGTNTAADCTVAAAPSGALAAAHSSQKGANTALAAVEGLRNSTCRQSMTRGEAGVTASLERVAQETAASFSGAAQALMSSIQAAEQASIDSRAALANAAEALASSLDRQAESMHAATKAATSLQASASAMFKLLQLRQEQPLEQQD